MKQPPVAAAEPPILRRASEVALPRIMKDCFGTVISSLKKMKECVRCELLRECRAINWIEPQGDLPPVVNRKPVAPASGGGESAGDPTAGNS